MVSSRLAVAAVTCWCAAAAADQTHHVQHGTVTNGREPIAGAYVIGARTTAITDVDGRFAIVVGSDEHELAVTAPGYALESVQLGAGELLITLDPATNEAIVITGRAPAPPPTPQAHVLTADEIHVLPGSGDDVLRAAQSLPGVARLPYSFGGIVLRGSSPRDNAVYLDGIEVPLAFHFGGLTSFFPSNMLAGLKVINGGFDAMYGRAQGGIVELATREPRTDAWRLGGSVGLLDSSVWAEGPVQDGGILFGIRRSYFDVVGTAFVPDTVPLPSYLDAQVRTSFGDPLTTGRIAPMLFASLDQVAVTSDTSSGQDSSTLSAFFVRAGVPYLRQWGPLALRAVAWLGAQSLDFESQPGGTSESFSRPEYPGGARADLSMDYPWGEVRTGVDLSGGYLSHSEEGLGQPGDVVQQQNGTTSIWWLDSALWSDARFDLGDGRISIKPGLRLERYGLTGEVVLDPRLAIREQLADFLVLRETVGRFHQPPTPGDVDPNGGNPMLKSSCYDQAALGVDATLGDGWSGSLTGYYNVGHDLGVEIGSAGPAFTDLGALGPTLELLLEKQLGLAFFRQNIGKALDRGIELSLKRVTERWLWMINYTLAYADRTEDPTILIGYRPFELDQRHNLNVIGSRRLGNWTLGARVQLVSGMPYTPGVPPGQPPVTPFAANLPWFFQLDLRADHRWHRDWGDINFYADIQNATNYPNVEGRETSFDAMHPQGFEKDIAGLPIAPFIGVQWIPK